MVRAARCKRSSQSGVYVATVVVGVMRAACAGQPLETETTRFVPAHTLQIESVIEYQAAKEGSELALPLAFEYGISDALQVLIEPVLLTSIRPDTGKSTTGIGDTEATLMYRLFDETAFFPALAIAAEVKIPTADNDRIGTGKADYTPFVIASKRVGRWDLHANVGYSFIGEPSGASVKNTFNYAVAAEFYATDKLHFVAEVLGNTSAIAGNENGAEGLATTLPTASELTTAPELGNSETTGLLGVRYLWTPALAFSFGLTYDNQHAFLMRPGITYSIPF